MKQVTVSFLFLLVLTSLTSCNLSNSIPDDWNPSVYGPIAKVELDLATLSKELNKEVDITLFPSIFGIDEIYAPIPPLFLPVVGPIRAKSSDIIQELQFESVEMTLDLTNSFPFRLLLPGSEIKVYNDRFDLIANFEFPDGVDANSTESVHIKLENVLFHSHVNVFVTKVGTKGSLIPVKLSKETNIHALGELTNAKIESIQLVPGKEITIKKKFEIKDLDVFKQQDFTGFLELAVQNDFPIQVGMQVQAFNEDSVKVLDLLDVSLSKGIFEHPEQSEKQTSIMIPIQKEELEVLGNSTYLEVSAVLSGVSKNLPLTGKNEKISIQLISDLSYQQ